MNTDYILRSQSGRNVFVCQDEERARLQLQKLADRGTRLRLFRVEHKESELAA